MNERDESVSTASGKQHEGNGRAALDPAAGGESGGAERRSKGGIEGLIGRRVAAATEHALDGPNQRLMRAQKPVWDAICKYYFRLETSGWERLPEETSLLIGNHSGGSLTIVKRFGEYPIEGLTDPPEAFDPHLEMLASPAAAEAA